MGGKEERKGCLAQGLKVCAAAGVPASLDAATLAGLLAGQDVDTVYLQSFASRAHGAFCLA